MGLHLVAGPEGGEGGPDRLVEAERMLGGTRDRLGSLADRLAELRRRLGEQGGAGHGGHGGSDSASSGEPRAEDPPAR